MVPEMPDERKGRKNTFEAQEESQKQFAVSLLSVPGRAEGRLARELLAHFLPRTYVIADRGHFGE